MEGTVLAHVTGNVPNFMIEMDKIYPEYGYAKHKGYPTKSHKEACRKYGPSKIQRLSFKY